MTSGRRRFSDRFLADLRDRVPLADVVGRHVRLARQGRELVGLCPFHGERSPSFTVAEAKGFYHCFGCGAHGDALDFLMAVENVDFVEAVEITATIAGMVAGEPLEPASVPPPKPLRLSPAELERKRQDEIEWARRVFGTGVPALGTLVEVYLRSRGIERPLPLSLRFAPALFHRESGRKFPAMLGGIQNIEGRLVGVHRTFLRRDGAGKADVEPAKKVGGIAWGGAVRLTPAQPIIVIGEGIETTLSVVASFYDAEHDAAMIEGEPAAFWAALSLGNIAGGGIGEGGPHPSRSGKRLPSPVPDPGRPGLMLPDIVRRVILLADADSGDPATAEVLLQRGARRFAGTGLAVSIARPPAGCDFNDVLRRLCRMPDRSRIRGLARRLGAVARGAPDGDAKGDTVFVANQKVKDSCHLVTPVTPVTHIVASPGQHPILNHHRSIK
jgi:DNA primase